MNRIHCFAILLVALLSLAPLSTAQEGQLVTDAPKGITPQEIIQKFAAKEKEFKEARDKYTYREDVRMQTLEEDGKTVTGEYREVFDVTFDPQGRHLENVVLAPQSTLTAISMSPEDLQDIRHGYPFVLTTDELNDYNVLYVGQQQEDELHCYVFDIAPKHADPKSKQRFFQGRAWVDDQDFQIVKVYGKRVPDIRTKHNENVFPKFTTWREQIDGKYWFPAYTFTDDTLHFRLGPDVRIRQIIKYTDYKRFGSSSTITYGDDQKQPEGNQKPK
jgi:outer membrane lipoprotein-sorting protein